MTVLQNAWSTLMPLPLLLSLSPPTKCSLCVEEVLTSDIVPLWGKLLGIFASFHTGVLDYMQGQLANSSATISIQPACDWPVDLHHPSFVIVPGMQKYCIVPHSKCIQTPTFILCRFLSQTKHRACSRGSKRNQASDKCFGTMVNRYGDG